MLPSVTWQGPGWNWIVTATCPRRVAVEVHVGDGWVVT